MDKTPFAKKSLGQHFLFDPNILNRVASATGELAGHSVIEIGPGPGGLTRAILDQGVDSLLCVEADVRFAEALSDWPEHAQGRLHVIHADATKCDWPNLIKTHALSPPVKIIANLPYNVGTKLVIDWIKAGDWRGDMAVMLQKEVAERICAAPNTRAYGRLSVLAHARCTTHLAFTLPPGAFTPPPKVDSAVVVMTTLPPSEQFGAMNALEAVTLASFGQRRKMLRKSLKTLFKNRNLEQILENIGIDPCARPETLPQDKFRGLANAWEQYNGQNYV